MSAVRICWPSGPDTNCFFVFFLPYLSIPSVPRFHTIACKPCTTVLTNHFQMEENGQLCSRPRHFPLRLGYRCRTSLNSKSVRDPIMRSVLWPHSNRLSVFQVKYQTWNFCFPWRVATKAISSVPLCADRHLALLWCSARFIFLKQIQAPGHSSR